MDHERNRLHGLSLSRFNSGHRLAVGLLAILMALGSGCFGAPSEEQIDPPRAGETAEAAAGLPATPAPAPIEANIEELKRILGAGKSKAVLVNVWATWCIPCREEFPDLVRLRRELVDQGFELLFVSADFDVSQEELVAFLTSQGVNFPSYLKVGNDMDFIDGLHPEWSGAVPASFLFDESGRLKDWWEGKVSYADLKEPVVHLLNGKDDA